MTCIIEDCTCEGRERANWPMAKSPDPFWHHKLRPRVRAQRKVEYEPDRFMRENLVMAWMGVE